MHSPSHLITFPICPQTFCAFLMFWIISGHSFLYWSRGLTRYLNCVTPSTSAYPCIPYILNCISSYLWAISTSLCCKKIYVSCSHMAVCLFFPSLTTRIFITQLGHHGSGVDISCSISTLAFHWLQNEVFMYPTWVVNPLWSPLHQACRPFHKYLICIYIDIIMTNLDNI